MITRSPTRTRSTCAPACSTTPTALWPRISGGTTGRCPCCMWQSVMQNAAPPVRTTTSSSAHGCSCTSSTTNGASCSTKTAARTATASDRCQRARRELRALRQGVELRPLDRLVDALQVRPLREPAVGAGDDVLRPDQARDPLDPLGDELGVLDDVRRVADDARREDLPGRQLRVLPHPPLVLVA